ncbi:GNAT family N-acetyltransferase [Dyadobacter frigoris]|uniref:GNAT family N-acetyltransferase n=1 Tax=Dyadobacter frigoris TaxID=2576211 RepID=A0A4U6D0C1_9BACT|nr:GNAT family N-acetyltransferase [Dyadobacter frigoris]TKT90599.1 GNAT family N-acetyltransferase [Dyadobacter frigoris]GLU51252.1 hypothetical protein Dfri01_07130 [Dyadobacter frigoris]
MRSAAHLVENYRFERLSHQGLTDLAWLYKAVYKKSLSLDYLAAKYDSVYTGHVFIGYIAYDQNGLPAAYYGVIPCFMSVSGVPLLAAQSADTMTHPDHQKKGLFFELATMTYVLCRKEHIRLVYGFPNQNSTTGLFKLNWQKIGELERFTFPVNTLPLEKIARQSVFSQKLYRRYAGIILKKYIIENQNLTKFPTPSEHVVLLKSDQYIQYKTYNESRTIKIGNACAWIKIQNGLIIGDISGFDNDFEEVILQLKKLCVKLGVHQLQFQESTKNRLHKLLKGHVDPAASFPIMIKDLGSGIDVSKIQFSFADIDIF